MNAPFGMEVVYRRPRSTFPLLPFRRYLTLQSMVFGSAGSSPLFHSEVPLPWVCGVQVVGDLPEGVIPPLLRSKNGQRTRTP